MENTQTNRVKFFLKSFVTECKKKHVVTLASSSSFFFFLCLIPFLYLVINFVAPYISPTTDKATNILKYMGTIIPSEIAPSFTFILEQINQMLLNQSENTLIHKTLLAISSLSFFGSIWKSIDIISEEKPTNRIMKLLKSILAIFISVLFIGTMILGPVMLSSAKALVSSEVFTKLGILQDVGFLKSDFLSFGFLSPIFILVAFIMFFQFVLARRATIISIFLGSTFFTSSIILFKFLFLSYIHLAKNNLIGNFGSFYTVLLFYLWVFLSILAFYLGIVFSITHSKVFYPKETIQQA